MNNILNNAETIDLLAYNDQYGPWLNDISELLELSSVKNNTFFDFGCGMGAWAMVASKSFDEVMGADFIDEIEKGKSLLRHNNIDNVTFKELISGINDLDTLNIKPIDMLISIMVIELIPSSSVIDLFQFASNNLSNDGRFLIVTRKRVGFLRTLLSFERFRWENPLKALKVLRGLFRGFVISLFSNEIKPSHRPRFYHNDTEIINLAKRFDLKLYKGQKELSKIECIKSLESNISINKFFNIRQSNWYIFEKNQES